MALACCPIARKRRLWTPSAACNIGRPFFLLPNHLQQEAMLAFPLLLTLTLSNSLAPTERPGSLDNLSGEVAASVAPNAFSLDSLSYQETHPDDGRWYLKTNFGFVTTESSDGPGEEIDFDEGYQLSAEFGYVFPTDASMYWTLGVEGLWNDQDAEDSSSVRDFSVGGLLLDATAHFPISEAWALYAGLGLGIAWVDVGTESNDITDFDSDEGPYLAWMLRGGAEYNINEAFSVHGGYRFQNVDDTEVDEDIEDSSFDLQTEQHILEVGLTFRL